MLIQRAANAFRKFRSGLPLRGGVSPEVPNDLFQAHLALYVFASRFARGQRVLVLGCGTGYGPGWLAAEGGAAAVAGIDADAASLAYARRRYPGVRFAAGAPEALPGDLGTFDLIVAANVLPHLAAPEAAVDGALRHLDAQGTFVAAVPPILDEHTMEAHRASAVHRANRYLWDWESIFRQRFGEIRLFRASPPGGTALDLSSPGPSRVRAEHFSFDEISAAQLGSAGSLSAVFVCRAPIPWRG